MIKIKETSGTAVLRRKGSAAGVYQTEVHRTRAIGSLIVNSAAPDG